MLITLASLLHIDRAESSQDTLPTATLDGGTGFTTTAVRSLPARIALSTLWHCVGSAKKTIHNTLLGGQTVTDCRVIYIPHADGGYRIFGEYVCSPYLDSGIPYVRDGECCINDEELMCLDDTSASVWFYEYL